ncbi:hypothetical protein AAX05_01185 [Moraxella bovoculi]|uniref:nucleoside triphosphate pyrophosphohydrolase family protein n=2 Tax=Moraxella bovoculi TaxID=386891 RepID=UPI0006246B16|nr:nucleoside triphosphate pyrophosphohydrolase family protein [Moraxella bovoculi]AKG09016.1 hypothetical protein AAX05_01185 [Moraxella bovoculi]AKG10851.1 hypothetical protein AAX07_01215 [Moraxella bovoculi]AKG14191.1 hypothetical protein AAX11_09400 [Moraxella bovoculi]
MTDQTLQSIIDWFKIAKPNPTNQNIVQQMAYHFEEVAEMCDAIGAYDMESELITLKNDLLSVSRADEDYADADFFIQHMDKKALLDALCDQIVTALGVGYMMGFDMEGALAEVNRSNYTKFTTDEQGNPIPFIDANGKIGKNPDTYRKPNLEPFIVSDSDK